jgi:hypothetical protein
MNQQHLPPAAPPEAGEPGVIIAGNFEHRSLADVAQHRPEASTKVVRSCARRRHEPALRTVAIRWLRLRSRGGRSRYRCEHSRCGLRRRE